MLVDQFEEQLDVPPTSLSLGDREGRPRKIVAQEDHRGVGARILEANAVQGRVELF